MNESIMAFIIWAIVGIVFILMGIYCLNSKTLKPFGFWANAEVIQVEDVKGYNRTLGKLWCVYGSLFIVVGVPLLKEDNSAWIIIPILGTMLLTIGTMIIYVVGIESKYRKKK
ncbi:MAG: hypothetical protein IKW28_06940 [Lachnospiraceae bacterium]|nr:hypothetical protein [Lachnospiraceae bacterium]